MVNNTEIKVENLVNPIIQNLGYELYDVEYVKEGKNYFLRIYIDKENGISLEDCEAVSNTITDALDEMDCIKEQYFLEVSSPGVERTIRKEKHLQNNVGKEIQVKLFKAIEGKKQFTGILQKYDELNIVLYVENKEVNLDRKNISQMKTVYNW